MSIIYKALVLIENPEALKMIAEAFPHPKYELEFADNLDEAVAHVSSKHIDMFVVDSKYAGDDMTHSIRRNIPTMIVEQEYVHPSTYQMDELNSFEEVGKIRVAAARLLRKSYVNWIIDALEYSS
ncbi:MAG: hypothetical protein WAO19_13720 [Candidatus Kryptoniota bacterium]